MSKFVTSLCSSVVWIGMCMHAWGRGVSPYLPTGARRRVSKHNDLGAPVEFDRIGGRGLISLRVLDYRYRWNDGFATSAFFGASRYDVSLAADGHYWGAGFTRTNLLRSDVDPDDLHGFYFDTNGVAMCLSRRF